MTTAAAPTITQEQVDFYHENGFLLVPKLLPDDVLQALRDETDRIVAAAAGLTDHNAQYDLEDSHTPEEPRVRRLKSPSTHWPFFRELAQHPVLMEVVTALIGPNVRLQNDKLNMKAAEYGAPVEWHQDWPFYPHTNDDLCAVGVALDDATPANGCMMVVPGSHQGPILDHHQDGYFIGAISPERDHIDLASAVPLAMKAGSLSIHHARTLHGSALNRSGRSRRLLLYQYAAVDAWPLGGVGNWDAFNANILCGSPTFDFRLTALTVRTRLPAGARRGGGIYELQKPLREKLFAAS